MLKYNIIPYYSTIKRVIHNNIPYQEETSKHKQTKICGQEQRNHGI